MILAFQFFLSFKKRFGNLLYYFSKIFLSFFSPTYEIKIKTLTEQLGEKNERRGISYDHKFENIAFFLVAKIKYDYTDFFYYKIVIDNF